MIKSVIKFWPDTGKIIRTEVSESYNDQIVWNEFIQDANERGLTVEEEDEGRYIVTLFEAGEEQ